LAQLTALPARHPIFERNDFSQKSDVFIKRRSKMKLRDVMTRNVEVIAPDALIQEAARKMKSLDVGSLPVCDGQRLVGMVTDRDLVVRALAQDDGRQLEQFTVQEVMTDHVTYCYEDDSIEEAARLMSEEQIRRLPVLNREKRLVGIVALGDVAVDTSDSSMSGEALKEISKPAEPAR
jgi:CBS domain-containing protein